MWGGALARERHKAGFLHSRDNAIYTRASQLLQARCRTAMTSLGQEELTNTSRRTWGLGPHVKVSP